MRYDTRVRRGWVLFASVLAAAGLATGLLGTGCGRTHEGSESGGSAGSAGSAGSESAPEGAYVDLARAQCAYLERCDPDALHRFSKSSMAACVDYFDKPARSSAPRVWSAHSHWGAARTRQPELSVRAVTPTGIATPASVTAM